MSRSKAFATPHLIVAPGQIEYLPEGYVAFRDLRQAAKPRLFSSASELDNHLAQHTLAEVDVWEIQNAGSTQYKVIDALGACYTYADRHSYLSAMVTYMGSTWAEEHCGVAGAPNKRVFVMGQQKGFWPWRSWVFESSESEAVGLRWMAEAEDDQADDQKRTAATLAGLMLLNGAQASLKAVLEPTLSASVPLDLNQAVDATEISWFSGSMYMMRRSRLWPPFLVFRPCVI